LFGAVMTGAATLFAMRADPSEHWSIPPTVTLRVDDLEGHAAGSDPYG
jgi:hypothetical protein